MGKRYAIYYTVNEDDGYVNHTAGDIGTGDHPSSLLLNWEFWDDDGYCDFWARMGPINIPKGSNIVKAELLFNVYYVPNGYVETELKIADVNTIPSTYGEFTSMVGTNNYLSIHLDQFWDEQINQYDVTEMVQEKIDSDDWAAGNNMIFFTSNTDGENAYSGADIDSYEYNPIMTLSIIFELPETTELTEILGGSRYEGFKYELLTLENGIYKHNGYLNNIQGGEITINFDRNIIGSANFDMEDDINLNYLSDLIRPYYWTVYDGETYNFPLGTFMLNTPNRVSDGMGVFRNIQGFDLLKALEDDKTTTSTYYAAGTNVYDTICDILDDVGIWVKYAIEPSTEVLAEDMTYELGKSKLFIINSLLNTLNYYPLWCTGMGVYKSIPWSDNKNITWNFEDNSNSLYESGILQTIDYTDIYNRVIIVAQQLTSDTEPLYKVWTFEDENLENHPLSYTQLGRYITKKFDSEAVSQDYVDLRARREIRKMLEIEEAINYNHAFVTNRFNDGLPNQGDHFTFKNTLLDVDEIYKIISHTYKLQVGELVKSSIRRVTSV